MGSAAVRRYVINHVAIARRANHALMMSDINFWARLFKTYDVVSYPFVKISNDNILNLPIFFFFFEKM